MLQLLLRTSRASGVVAAQTGFLLFAGAIISKRIGSFINLSLISIFLCCLKDLPMILDSFDSLATRGWEREFL